MLYVLIFIWQDVKCYAIKIITQSSNMNTISDILFCGSISIIFFSEWKNFQMYRICLNFSWSWWKSISEQLCRCISISCFVFHSMLISICHMNMDIHALYFIFNVKVNSVHWSQTRQENYFLSGSWDKSVKLVYL